MSTEHFYTAKQLAGLPGMPGTERGVRKMADRENWSCREREGRGGGREYPISALPDATRIHLRKALVTAEVRKTVADVIKAHGIVLPETQVRDWQRITRDARDGLINAIKIRMQESGKSADVAYAGLVDIAIEAGEQSHEYKMLIQAKDARGLKASND